MYGFRNLTTRTRTDRISVFGRIGGSSLATRLNLAPRTVQNMPDCFRLVRAMLSPFSPADQKLAAGFFRQRVRLEQIETALLLGCAREYVTMLNGRIGCPITSPAYFQAVVDEVGKLQMSAD